MVKMEKTCENFLNEERNLSSAETIVMKTIWDAGQL